MEGAERLSPTLVVVDVSLAEGDIADLLHSIHDRAPATRVLLLSAHDEPTVVKAVLAAGADGLVLSRAIATDLLPAVDALLAGSRYVSPRCGQSLIQPRTDEEILMYFTDDSLFPENMQPTIITAAPYGPEWLPGDVEDLPSTWDAAGAGGGRLLQRRRHDAALPRARSEDRPGFEQFRPVQRAPRARPAGGAEDDHPGRRLDLVRAAHGGRQGQVARLRHPPHADRAEPEAGLRHGDDRHDAVGHHAGVHRRTTPTGRTWTTRRSRRPGAAWSWTRRRPSTSST